LLGGANAGTTEDMARKRTPEVSTLKRPNTIAYARKQKPEDNKSDFADDETVVGADASDSEAVKAAIATMKMPAQHDEAPPLSDRPTMQIDPAALAAARDPRPRVETTGMPMGDFGAPPEIPSEAPATVIKGGAVEDPTHMPGPREIPAGNPDDVASPPGFVPRGDSRSLRRRQGDTYEFALVYRKGNAVISRVGAVGTRGVWRVVEYPTTSSASHAYAREASRFVTEGFFDYRE
jgi:hypothetical protein